MSRLVRAIGSALTAALLAVTTAQTAAAQGVPSGVAPLRNNLYERGVDVVTGKFNPSQTTLSNKGRLYQSCFRQWIGIDFRIAVERRQSVAREG